MFETFQLSNDAFYYLKDGEEPLVDEALDEALAVEALYPDGFTILDFKPLYQRLTIGLLYSIRSLP